MTVQDWGLVVALFTGLISLLRTFSSDRHKEAVRIAKERADWEGRTQTKLDMLATQLAGEMVKTDTMWQFQMRRAESEIITRGLGIKHSPLVISEEAKKWMASLRDELRAFYRELGREMTAVDLMLAIERHYGDRLLEEVCIPHGLFEGACLLIAAAVAQESNVLNITN